MTWLKRASLPLVFFLLLLGFPLSVRPQSTSLQSEMQWAEYVRADILTSQPLLRDSPYNHIVDRVMLNLLETNTVNGVGLPYVWEWFVADDPGNPNAATYPGGKFVVYSGLGAIFGDEESLWAAVMAHEVGHALCGHPMLLMERAVARQQLADQVSRAQSTGGAIAAFAATLAYSMALNKLSRDEESRADELGLLIMAEAGYAPDFAFAMHEAFRQRFGDVSRFTAFFQQHPREVTRTERSYRVYAQARALYDQARFSDRARGSYPPPWAMIWKPALASGVGDDGSPGLFVRVHVAVHNAYNPLLDGLGGQEVTVGAVFWNKGKPVRSLDANFRLSDGSLCVGLQTPIRRNMEDLGEVTLFIPYRAVDPRVLGKKIDTAVGVADGKSTLGVSEFVGVKLPSVGEVRRMSKKRRG